MVENTPACVQQCIGGGVFVWNEKSEFFWQMSIGKCNKTKKYF